MRGRALDRPLRAVIWDFNGTLIDDVDLALHAVNLELDRRGLPRVARESYRSIFGFPMEDYYRKLGFDLRVETMAGLADEFRAGYVAGLWDCPLHEGVREILDDLHAAGIPQFVLSAMEEATLNEALRRLGVEGCFRAAYGLGDWLADSKVSRGQALVERFRIPASLALLVGDTDHDAEVGQALGIPVVLVAEGHQTTSRLRQTGRPVFADFPELKVWLFDSRTR